MGFQGSQSRFPRLNINSPHATSAPTMPASPRRSRETQAIPPTAAPLISRPVTWSAVEVPCQRR
jgi:hypothetical protein